MPTPILKPYTNGVYYAFWTDENGRTQRQTMGSKEIAKAEANFAQWLLLRNVIKGEESIPAVVTIADCWTVYKEKKITNPPPGESPVATAEGIIDVWERLLEPHFGKLTIPQLTQAVVDQYVEKHTNGTLRSVKPQTCRNELATLMAIVTFCSKKQPGVPNPLFSSTIIEAIKLPPAGEPRDRWLRTHEMQRMFDAAAAMRRGKKLSRGERFLWLALFTAGRAEAIMDLTWDRVDFEIGVIFLDVPDRKKTTKGRASVPIAAALRPVLERAYRERENDLVMTNKGAIWATVQLIAIDAGFGDGQEKPKHGDKPKATGISPHVLRHTAATHMARNGTSLWKIAKILGNSLAMVEKVYAKHVPDDPDGTVNRIAQGIVMPGEEILAPAE